MIIFVIAFCSLMFFAALFSISLYIRNYLRIRRSRGLLEMAQAALDQKNFSAAMAFAMQAEQSWDFQLPISGKPKYFSDLENLRRVIDIAACGDWEPAIIMKCLGHIEVLMKIASIRLNGGRWNYQEGKAWAEGVAQLMFIRKQMREAYLSQTAEIIQK